MINKAEYKRMLKARHTIRKTNCIGSVLYVLGAIREDSYVGLGERRWNEGLVERFLSGLIRTEIPRLGGVLVVRGVPPGSTVRHMGLIVNEHPVLVFNRPGVDAEICSDEPLADIIDRYSPLPIEFYERPRSR